MSIYIDVCFDFYFFIISSLFASSHGTVHCFYKAMLE